jgi:hypothetical protein
LARRRHGADLDEDIEGVELVPMLDEASVLDRPDVGRRMAKALPVVPRSPDRNSSRICRSTLPSRRRLRLKVCTDQTKGWDLPPPLHGARQKLHWELEESWHRLLKPPNADAGE